MLSQCCQGLPVPGRAATVNRFAAGTGCPWDLEELLIKEGSHNPVHLVLEQLTVKRLQCLHFIQLSWGQRAKLDPESVSSALTRCSQALEKQLKCIHAFWLAQIELRAVLDMLPWRMVSRVFPLFAEGLWLRKGTVAPGCSMSRLLGCWVLRLGHQVLYWTWAVSHVSGQVVQAFHCDWHAWHERGSLTALCGHTAAEQILVMGEKKRKVHTILSDLLVSTQCELFSGDLWSLG